MTVWLSERLVLAIHDEQLAEHGGAAGLRDRGLLQSAIARPLNAASYAEPTVAELAALYAIAIARNHPFIDGKKRTAFAALTTFLGLNGMEFGPPEPEAVMTMLTLAASEIDDATFTAWVSRHAQSRD